MSTAPAIRIPTKRSCFLDIETVKTCEVAALDGVVPDSPMSVPAVFSGDVTDVGDSPQMESSSLAEAGTRTSAAVKIVAQAGQRKRWSSFPGGTLPERPQFGQRVLMDGLRLGKNCLFEKGLFDLKEMCQNGKNLSTKKERGLAVKATKRARMIDIK